MGYIIQYSQETQKRYPIRRKSKRLSLLLSLCFCVFVLFLAIKFRTDILRILLPGDSDITTAALQNLITDIREGNSGAVAAFCREIIDHATG